MSHDNACVPDCAGLTHSLRVLYVDASSSKYAGSTDKARMLDQLTSLVSRLPVDQCIAVLQVSVLILQYQAGCCVATVWVVAAVGYGHRGCVAVEGSLGNLVPQHQPRFILEHMHDGQLDWMTSAFCLAACISPWNLSYESQLTLGLLCDLQLALALTI